MNPSRRFEGRTVILVGLVCGAAGIGLFIGGLLLGREQTMISYLTAYVYVLSLAIGALVWLVMTATMGAIWPTVIRRVAEAIAGLFPLLALLLLPILLELPVLYPWVHPTRIPDRHTQTLVMRKVAYLNVGFFVVRAAVYLCVLTVAAELTRAWSLRQDADTMRDARRRIRAFSSGMLGPLALVVSALAFDWIMSIDPGWSSSMFGLYFAAGALLGATCLVVLIALQLQRSGVLPLNRSHHYAFGRTLLTFLLLWAYTGFFQFMLIWIADEPRESSWYVTRGNPGWYWMTVICIFLCHFVVPLLALLPYGMKRSATGLACVAAWILACHFLDVYWMIHPSLRTQQFDFNGMDVAMLVGVCGLCVAFGAWRMRGQPMAAWRDPEFEEALQYRSV